MKNHLLFFFLLINANLASQENIHIEEKNYFKSRKKILLNKEQNKTIQIDELNEFINYYVPKEKTKSFIDSYILNSKDNKELYGNLILNYAKHYYSKGNIDSTKHFIDKTIQFSKKNKFRKLYIDALEEASFYYIKTAKRKKANDSINKAIKLSLLYKFEKKTTALQLSKIRILQESGFFIKSLQLAESILKKKRIIKNVNNKLDLFGSLAKIYGKINDLDNQKKYLDKYILLAKKTALKNLNTIYYSKSNYHFKKGELSKALNSTNLGLKIAKEKKDSNNIYLFNANKGTILLYLGQFKEAEKILFETLKYEKEKNYLENSANTLEDLSRVYYYLNDNIKSKIFFDRAIDSVKKIKNNHYLLAAFYENKYLDLKENDNFKESIIYLEKHHSENKKIFESKFYEDFAQLEIKFKTQQKENQILKLSNENVKKEAETKRKKTQLNYSLFGGASILLLSLFTFRAYKKEKKSKKRIEIQKKEIETLHRELHHRVKNNLAVALSFISVAKENIDENKAKEALYELENRILNIASIHEVLYKQDNVSIVNLQTYIEQIYNQVSSSFNIKNLNIEHYIKADFQLPLDQAMTLGFIINEILTNSFKHAFKGRKNGIIHINIVNKKNKIEFTASDNGTGIPNEFSIEKTNSYGTELIHTLVMQLNGTIEVKNKNGTEINLLIPKH